MQARTATITARIEPTIKERAELVLSNLGLSTSTVIDALYRQIIFTNSIPFPLSAPDVLKPIEDMSKAEFDAMLQTGYNEALSHQGTPARDVFHHLRSQI